MSDLLSELEPTQKQLSEILQKRTERLYQRRHRGGKRSASDESENAAIMLAWEAGEITEGQAAKALGVDRVSAREMKLKAVALGRALAQELQ